FEEWDAIPEASTGIRQHKREDTFTPVSDAIILAGAGLKAMGQSNLNVERGRMLRDQLDEKRSGNASTKVDAEGYLTSLNEGGTGALGADMQVGDVKRARLLFKSVTSTNPTHPPGWIAAARLEEVAGNMIEARRIIKSACAACPKSEEVWVEAARLNTPANAKVILENALRRLPRSVSLWLRAADLESGNAERKKRVLRRALETLPNSKKLWKAAVELEEDEADAHILLAQATECVPHAVDLWLALAQLESYEQAKRVLNKAGKKNPAEPRIWVMAAALEEAHLSETGPPDAAAQTALLKRLSAILKKAADWKRTWLDEVTLFADDGHVSTARALLREMIERFKGQKDVLLKGIAFESKFGSKQTLNELLLEAVQKCPEAELFWLMAAKESWKTSGDVEGARKFLADAFEAGHNSERVWLAAAKLEWESNEVNRARALLQRARQQCSTARIWQKSGLLERTELAKLIQSGADPATVAAQLENVRTLLKVGRERFPSDAKLWMMGGQLEVEYVAKRASSFSKAEVDASVVRAREIYLEGLKRCPSATPLWTLAAELEEGFASAAKARSVLELARVKNKGQPQLWVAAIRLERRHGQGAMADLLMAKALQECPKAGVLWAEVVLSASKADQKSKSVDALETCDQDALVFCAVARVFAGNRKLKAARKWFESAVTCDPDLGDAWAWYYHLELHVAAAEPKARAVLERAQAAAPGHGELWQRSVTCQIAIMARDNVVREVERWAASGPPAEAEQRAEACRRLLEFVETAAHAHDDGAEAQGRQHVPAWMARARLDLALDGLCEPEVFVRAGLDSVGKCAALSWGELQELGLPQGDLFEIKEQLAAADPSALVLDLRGFDLVSSLPDVELELQHVSLRDCAKLERASSTTVATTRVGEDCDLTQCYSLSELPEGMHVAESLILDGCSALHNLPENLNCGMHLSLSFVHENEPCRLETLPASLCVRGMVAVHTESLTHLPEQWTVGALDLCDCANLIALPRGLVVETDLDLSGCFRLRYVAPDVKVGGNLSLAACTGLLAYPPAFTHVFGTLSIAYLGSIFELPEEMVVEGDLVAAKSGLMALPADIRVDGQLDLKDCTELSKLPDEMRHWGPDPMSGAPHKIFVSGSGIIGEELDRWREIDAPNLKFYTGTRGIHNHDVHFRTPEALDPFQELAEAVSFWEAATEDADNAGKVSIQVLHDKVGRVNERGVLTFLSKLREAQEFQYDELRPGLAARVVEALELLCNSGDESREEILVRMGDSVDNCADKPVWALGQLTLLGLVARARGDRTKLRDLGRRVLNLSIVHEHVSRKLASLGVVDDVTVYLRFEIALRSDLDLPVSSLAMLFPNFIEVTQAELDAAREEASAVSEDHFEAWLADWEEWQRQERFELAVELKWGDLPSQSTSIINRLDGVMDLSGQPLQDPVVLDGSVWSLADLLRHWVATGMDLNNLVRSAEDLQTGLRKVS
ncbi:Pre-mRNA-processing factor 6 (PRP6 homolog) (U5 snRNP-associated 102 kDa protein) (U5-102 kDa protein), partial [Durusdinium trenchii]